jgi:glucose/arabinose dehydrogenase
LPHHGERKGAAHQPGRQHPGGQPLAAPGTTVPSCNGSCGSAPASGTLVAGARTEIWAWAFAIPFRFSFDPQTGNLWVGDVGEVSYEEIDLVRKGQH